MQNLAGGLAIAPFAFAFERVGDIVPSTRFFLALAYSVVLVSIVAYLLWFHILKVSGATVEYVGSPRADERYATAALITYKLTREMWLKGEYRHEWRHSNVAGNDYQADVVLVGARLQR